jgi:3-methylcrotonyl-CoA carboxylase alpha subunit
MSDVTLRSAGTTTVVSLVPVADGHTATVDGTAHHVAAPQVARTIDVGQARVEEMDVVIDGRTHRALVARTRDRIHVAITGSTVVFERVDDTAAAGGAGAGSGTVVAPMPGKVVKVLVATGDTVAVGQALVVIEAMKMETTLVAEVAGTVAMIDATPGAMVDAGAVVVEITEPS